MHAADGPAWALGIEHSAIGQAMRGGVYLYPAVETVHILGFATLIGAILVLDLRLLGVGRGLPPMALARLAVPVAAAGLGTAIATGSLLFVTEAAAYVRNPVFLIKQGLILLGLANVAVFHWRLKPILASWDGEAPPPRAVRQVGVASAAVWIGAAICGRLIAYL